MCEKMIDLLLENCPLFLNVGFWARLPSLNVEVFAQRRASECPSPPQKSTLRERGGARPRNCVNFPIRKRNKIDEQDAKHRKKRTFLDEAGAEMERLNWQCFRCSAAPKKAAPIVDMLGGPFRKFQAFSYHFESKVRISFANINIEREGRSAAEKLYQFSNKKRYRIDEETFLGRKIPQRTYF